MILETPLLVQTRQFAESLLKQLPETYTYHNISHTREVVQAAEKIGTLSGLNPEQLEEVMVAAWLHDVGYLKGLQGHEEFSIAITEPFLRDHHVNEDRIKAVTGCIQATRMPQQPRNKVEEVLCDADLFHLSSPLFFDKSELLRQEIKLTHQKISKKKWLKGSVSFMECHQYFTDYGKSKLTLEKMQNVRKIHELITRQEAEENGLADEPVQATSPKLASPPSGDSEQLPDNSFKAEAKKNKRPDRGIETMFRVTSQNHIQLSAIADTKANIMISVNSIIVSLILSILIRKLEDVPQLILPTALLTFSCLLATVFAILAARPNVTSGRFTKEDIENKQANLLFFGNFHKMSLPDYEWGIRAMMADGDFLYSSMTRDIYFLGKVLGKKYQLLRLSYTIFMFGFVVSVIAFAIAAYLYPMR